MRKILRKILRAGPAKVSFTAVCVLVAALLAWFAQDLAFYKTDTGASAYTIAVEHSSDPSLTRESPLNFVYNGQQIVLLQGGTIPDGCATLYGLSAFGTAMVSEENMENMSAGYLGSFAAVVPVQVFDITGDGVEENVYLSAKTDIRSIQSNASTTPVFRDPLIMLEAGLYNARQLIVYYNTRPLSQRTVTVRFANGKSAEYETLEDGRLEGIPIPQIRKGVTIEYRPNARNVYLIRYTPERANILSAAVIPLLNTLVLTTAAILACLFLQRRVFRRDGVLHRAGAAGAASAPRAPSRFMVLRWSVMAASFLLLTWGGSLLGFWFENITPPVFACGRYNPEQLTGSACYYLSHLNLLADLPVQNIVMFLLSFFLPTVLFGRILCGFVCPMGLVQDTLDRVRQASHTHGITLGEKLYERLRIIKWTFMMLFVGMCFAGLDFCNVCPVLTLSPGFSGFKTSVYVGGFLMVFALVGSFFKRRMFCNICPLGLTMGLFWRISIFRLKKDCDACTECGACYSACPMGIKEIYTERDRQDVTDINCLMCGECIRQCPEDGALSLTCLGRKVYTASREGFMRRFEGKEKANV